MHDTVELENGEKAMREIVAHPGGVCVAALTEENELLFVRQFRYPYKEVTLELPAGKLEKGQNPLENGKRELLEETGAVGSSYISLGQVYPSPGYTDEIIHLYIAHNVTKVPRHLDEDENIDIYYFSIDEVKEMIMKGQIKDAKTISLVFKYLNK